MPKIDFEERLKEIITNSKILNSMTPQEQKRFYQLYQQNEKLKLREDAKQNFMSFVKAIWPGFVEGRHHKIIAEKFNKIADGSLKRLIVNMPPRHTKSEFASFLLPAYIMGKNPQTKIIQTSHTAELSQRFGRKTKQLIDSSDYSNIFPDTILRLVWVVPSRAVVRIYLSSMTRTRSKMRCLQRQWRMLTSGTPLVPVNVYSPAGQLF